MICQKCNKDLPKNDFYQRTGRKKSFHSYCKECFNYYCCLRWYERKLRAIKLLGGKCIDCGYNKHPAALQFHHLNPEEKEFNWTKMRLKRWDKIEKELQKCILLCANCHSIRHSSFISIQLS